MPQVILILVSVYFYACYSLIDFAIIICSLLFNWGVCQLINKDKCAKRKKFYLICAIVINITLLLYFKYLNFIVQNLSLLFQGKARFIDIIMPLGISYYTIQQIAYLIDTYRGETKNNLFLEYTLFVLYFPKIISGPIVFQNDFISQLRKEETYKFSIDNCSRGIYTFIIGLAKKILIADKLAPLVTNGFNSITSISSIDAILVMLGFSFQLYFDFSGYCDMACGISGMFNITLPLNFDDPYKSTSINDFWKKWHVSLTDFFRKYIYFPLGGSRNGNIKTIINILIIYLISGLWHGANWTFLLWGLLHGVASIFNRFLGKYWVKINNTIKWIINFGFISLTWIVFRAKSVTDALSLYKRFFVGGLKLSYKLEDILLLIICFIIVLVFKNITNKDFKLNYKRALIAALLFVLCLLNFTSQITYIYENF